MKSQRSLSSARTGSQDTHIAHVEGHPSSMPPCLQLVPRTAPNRSPFAQHHHKTCCATFNIEHAPKLNTPCGSITLPARQKSSIHSFEERGIYIGCSKPMLPSFTRA
ncbi:hypothetical protein DUNSADRAFT_4398 [Dunaliella salina]|uniref:Encoded protein n=1 Tax=Dunaliella salina TaxID=3046 RepID=A0ABQ7GS79_DUNSA|nr:hypothetical protein DUNSADRAFT_4398 [Dunaliella salina]|eukprot:KAF5837418.1 hypothetical protein DUNSADRAFT_4398 [Dunaliella salina]